jgi:hypothetical protein
MFNTGATRVEKWHFFSPKAPRRFVSYGPMTIQGTTAFCSANHFHACMLLDLFLYTCKVRCND